MAIFSCQSCGEEFVEHSFKIVFEGEKKTYKNHNGDIKCKWCKSLKVHPLDEPGDFSKVKFPEFSIKSPEEKKKSLRKRADESYRKNNEKRQYMRKNFNGKMSDL